MNATEFARRIAATGMSINDRTAKAARLVLVDGMSAYAAAKQIGISQSAIGHAKALLLDRAPAGHCPKCGGVI